MKLVEEIEGLFEKQLQSWDMARENYAGLQQASLKTFHFNGSRVLAQFNPKRIISSSAKTDPVSISERPCFLCKHNRPVQQQGIPFMEDYLILINPYPVFNRHLTIPTLEHESQRISGRFATMLQLAKELTDYTIIYNGPNCGASAPDHFHFQAIPQGILPVESELSATMATKHQNIIKNIRIEGWDAYQRGLITFTGTDPDAHTEIFNTLFSMLVNSLPAADEPMMNILAHYKQRQWIVYIFPRRQHRPHQYFETGDNQLMVSPASIDLGGVLVIPRQEDFNRITRNDVESIYEQVCVDDFFIHDIIQNLWHEYGRH